MNGLRLTVALLFASALAPAQQPDPRVRTIQVTAGVHMLQGNGGNVGVGVGEEGVFVIDDQFAPMVGQIKAAVARLTDQEVRFVVNTHWHGDHTGGNERFGKAGAVILAHTNVRERMSVEQFMAAMNRRVPPSPPGALPVVTFTQEVTLHWGGDDVRIFHVEHAHTDGDAVVWFEKANVFHMGDVFFQSGYPFIDTGSGGSLPGLIAAVERVLSLADDASRIIPGHGDLTDKAGLREYHAMLTRLRDRVTDLVVKGHVADEVVAAAPSREWDERWGKGFMTPERFVRTVYAEVVRVRHAGDAPVPRVHVKGSDLMLELGQAWARGFAATPAPRPEIAVAGGGTSPGLAALLAGEAHVALLGRLPRDREVAAAAERGVVLRSVPVVRQVLAVTVHRDNPVASLTLARLGAIFGDGGDLARWSHLDVDLPAGGDDAIVLVGAQENSAAAEGFRGLVLGRRGYRLGMLCLPGAKDVMAAVSARPAAIGFAPLSYATAAEGVRTVPVAAADGAEAVPPEHAAYPLVWPLYVAFRADLPAEARALVDWIGSPAGQEVTRAAGFVPAGAAR